MKNSNRETTPYIIGIDLGSNSVGFAAVQKNGWDTLEDPSHFGILNFMSHVFDDAGEDKNGTRTLKNQDRRKYRLARKTYRRKLQRKQKVYEALVSYGWLSENEKERAAFLCLHTKNGEPADPWTLRKKGLDEKLTLPELAKCIVHLARHRGYQSTGDLMAGEIPEQYRLKPRYLPIEEDDEANNTSEDGGEKLGVILTSIQSTYQALEKGVARTYGELIWQEIQAGRYARHYQEKFKKERKNKKPEPEAKRLQFRSDRALIKLELIALWNAQSKHHQSELTPDRLHQLQNIIFHQIELQGTDDKRLTCTMYRSRYCAKKASDAAEKIRILKDLIENIEVGPKPKKGEAATFPWTEPQLRTLLSHLSQGKDLTLEEIAELTGVKLEHIRPKPGKIRKTSLVLGNRTRRIIHTVTDQFGNLTTDQQTQVIDILTSARWPSYAYLGLMKTGFFNQETAAKLALTPLPSGSAGYCTKFLNRVAEKMITDQLTETGATFLLAKEITEQRANFEVEEPNYEGTSGLIVIGKNDLSLRNPIVERAIRRAIWGINQLIYRYGFPEVIRVELPRDLTMSAKDKYELEKKQSDNEKNRNVIRQELIRAGVNPTVANLRKAILLQECNFILSYEGRTYSYAQLEELEIDHALPRSFQYINDNKNLILCTRETNGNKGNLFLYDFISENGNNPTKWNEFVSRINASKMSRTKKAWLTERFPDKTQRSSGDEPKKTHLTAASINATNASTIELDHWMGDQLAATGYIAKKLKAILVASGAKVEVVNGKATAHLRQQWGLNDFFPDWLGEAKRIKAEREGKAEELSASKPKKNRSDHRHHAIDALVVALTDVSTMQRISRAYRDRPDRTHRIDFQKTCPIQKLRGYIDDTKDNIPVTQYSREKLTGQLNEATAQRKDLAELPESLKTGEPKSVKIAEGKLIRYDWNGKASQVYKLGENHHFMLYRAKTADKKGKHELRAEIVSLIEVAMRQAARQPVYQPNADWLQQGFEHLLTLHKGDVVEHQDYPNQPYIVSAISYNKNVATVRLRSPECGTMDQNLFNRKIENKTPVLNLTSLDAVSNIKRQVKVNLFGDVL